MLSSIYQKVCNFLGVEKLLLFEWHASSEGEAQIANSTKGRQCSPAFENNSANPGVGPLFFDQNPQVISPGHWYCHETICISPGLPKQAHQCSHLLTINV